MTCAVEQRESRLAASGGLDNMCSIYELGAEKAHVELQGHDGYLSCCRFVEPHTIVTASGDSTCISWDINRAEDVQHFTDHGGDVLSLSVHPTNKNIFVSGSCDTTAKVWDMRAGHCVQTFVGHEGDINAIRFMPNGLCFSTGSDDTTIKLFDLRSYARVNEFVSDSITCGITSVDFSASGRVLFGGYDDGNAYGWDILSENTAAPAYTLSGHTNRVSCVGVNNTGQAICTGSWDNSLAIWA
jgi:guanine nucleotide-binding protein G(I)/G(S)/G(T) subunit beta-1